MSKRFVSVAAIAALAISVAGCGTDSSKTGTGSSGAGNSAGGPATIASKMVMGGPTTFSTRADGLPGLKSVYGVQFGKFTVTDTGGPVTVNALKNGQVDAADIFSTDPSIKANDFVVLTDPKSNFAAQNVVPIMTKSMATPGVKTVLNAVQAKLTTDDLGNLVSQVTNDKKDPAAVAKSWLSTAGLDKKSSGAAGTKITVGSADFSENIVLAQIYIAALQDAGANVTAKLNIGSREKYFPALKAGSINLIPEYTGVALTYLDKTAKESKPDEVYAALAKVLPGNLVALDKASAQDSDAIVVTKATAEKYKLTSIADLAKPAN